MSNSPKKKPLALALLLLSAGAVMTAAGGWMAFRLLAYSKIAAVDFRAEEQQGAYIQLTAPESFEIGYQVEYSSSEPLGSESPSNRVGRLLGIPIDRQLLIVLVPTNHTGTTFRGSVKELSSEIEMALTMNSMNQTFSDLEQRLESLRPQSNAHNMSELIPNSFNDRPTPAFHQSPSLKDFAMPVYLDAKEDERGAIAMILVVGLAFLGGGVYLLISPANASTNKPSFGDTDPKLSTDLDSSMTTIATARSKKDSTSHALEGAIQQTSIELQCPNGHSFSVPSIYRGTRRKCPTCGSVVES